MDIKDGLTNTFSIGEYRCVKQILDCSLDTDWKQFTFSTNWVNFTSLLSFLIYNTKWLLLNPLPCIVNLNTFSVCYLDSVIKSAWSCWCWFLFQNVSPFNSRQSIDTCAKCFHLLGMFRLAWLIRCNKRAFFFFMLYCDSFSFIFSKVSSKYL